MFFTNCKDEETVIQKPLRLCVSSICPDKESAGKVFEINSSIADYKTNMTKTVMIRDIGVNVNCKSSITT